MVAVIHVAVLLVLCSFFSAAPALTISLNSTLTDGRAWMVCRDTPLWMDPPWTSSVTYDCNRVIEMLIRVQPESLNSHAPFPHEFLPLGMSQKEYWPDPVRTPWKLTVGSCTMAVTTLASVAIGFLPTEVGPGPFPDNGVDYWWDIRNSLSALTETCVNNRKGGIRWYLPGATEFHPEPKPSLGLFIYATGSAIDKALGPRTNPVLVLPGFNLTKFDTTILLNNTS
ncbi:hypothetical protein JMJ35_002632 [Cladonia borealis]|uniref:Uncharacterized protein n=1 Tax=Cladonia borealis TaxID=184061 RepID=A0AA39R5H8_9LECA|nr:hypothetical protein JMJ35_002632 [Cladonia borealis]